MSKPESDGSKERQRPFSSISILLLAVCCLIAAMINVFLVVRVDDDMSTFQESHPLSTEKRDHESHTTKKTEHDETNKDDAMMNNNCENDNRRRRIIQRAQRWLDANVQYNFNAFHEGYRTQCSGFVSAAWNLRNPIPEKTPRCFDFEPRGLAKVISKHELEMGDAMVCNSHKNDPWKYDKRKPGQQGGGHCLLFEKWTDDSRTAYVGWELCADADCQGVNRREIPYPYFYKKSCWEPMQRYDMDDCS
jgi:hypothetical protein